MPASLSRPWFPRVARWLRFPMMLLLLASLLPLSSALAAPAALPGDQDQPCKAPPCSTLDADPFNATMVRRSVFLALVLSRPRKSSPGPWCQTPSWPFSTSLIVPTSLSAPSGVVGPRPRIGWYLPVGQAFTVHCTTTQLMPIDHSQVIVRTQFSGIQRL